MKNVISLKKSARYWEDGLPIGNGKLGAMVMGKVNEETIFINEETLWYGPNRNRKNPDSLEYLGEIRDLLVKGEVQKAQFLGKMAMTSTPKYVNPYQPVGDLRICFLDHKEKTSNYLRSLDIDNALAHVAYEMKGIQYKRELLVSQKYNVVAIKLTASLPKSLTLSVNISRKPFEENTAKINKNTAANWGQCGVDGVNYFSAVRLEAKGGEISTIGDFVYAQDADEVYIYLTAETDFQDNHDYKENCLKRLDLAESIGYDEIKKEHIAQYHSVYNRVSLDINHCQTDTTPTNELLESLRLGEIKQSDYLTLLLFNFARYLMIASSNECVLPSNLQGIWNGSYVPPWQSEFTININTEMNYWMAEKCNLSQCHMPLFDLIERLVINGRKTAKEIYGCRGFCAHHNTNIWANTDTEGIFDESPMWPMGGAWLSLHMYEHFLFTEDKEFLKERALPVMGEAITFFEDYLYENEKGELVTGPSVSPENVYISHIGVKGALCMGPSMDIQILRQLFTWYIDGCKLVNLNKTHVEKVEQMLAKLPKTKISKNGRIMEWQEDYEELDPGHRHISHLYGLHPGVEITEEDPLLFEAAEKTLEHRLAHGGGHTGWSRAWIACFYARLKNGEKMLENLNGLLQNSIQDNMLDTHPPFQIDGNFGIAEAMIESLVQSHGTYIEILPALPVAWENGEFKGVCLRGNLQANITWNKGTLTSFVVTSKTDKEVSFKYKDTLVTKFLKADSPTEITIQDK